MSQQMPGEFLQQFPRVIRMEKAGRMSSYLLDGHSEEWPIIPQPQCGRYLDTTELALDRPLWWLLAACRATHWIGASRITMMVMPLYYGMSVSKVTIMSSHKMLNRWPNSTAHYANFPHIVINFLWPQNPTKYAVFVAGNCNWQILSTK